MCALLREALRGGPPRCHPKAPPGALRRPTGAEGVVLSAPSGASGEWPHCVNRPLICKAEKQSVPKVTPDAGSGVAAGRTEHGARRWGAPHRSAPGAPGSTPTAATAAEEPGDCTAERHLAFPDRHGSFAYT